MSDQDEEEVSFASADLMKHYLNKRTVLRRQFTKQEKLCRKHYDSSYALLNADINTEESYDLEVKYRTACSVLEQIHVIYNELKTTQGEIELDGARYENMSEQEREREDESELHYNESYSILCAELQALGDRILPKNPSPPSVIQSDDISEVNSIEHLTKSLTDALKSVNSGGVSSEQFEKIIDKINNKKKEIRIPYFNGDSSLFDQWREMLEDEFKKQGYTACEKAYYTISLLQGEAQKIGASLKDPSYEDLIKVLENRYGDVLTKIQNCVIEISNLKTVPIVSVKDLDDLYNKVLANWNYICKKSNDAESLKANSWILTALVRPKLPRALIRKWDSERRDENNLPISLDKLLVKLYDALQIQRRIECGDSNDKRKDFSNRRNDSKPSDQRPTGHALNVSVARRTSTPSAPRYGSRVQKCVFCGEIHASYRCDKVKNISVEKRCELVKQAQLCLNCFSDSHFVVGCTSRGCRECGRKHHSLLHYPRQSNSNTASSDSSSSVPKAESVSEPKSAQHGSVSLVKSVRGHSVLLQTAIVQVETVSSCTQARVLFDQGSDVTLISRKLANKLNLKGRDLDAQFTLVGGKLINVKTQLVKFNLSSAIPNWKGEEFEIEAYVIDKTASKLHPVSMDLSNMSHLKDLPLADSYPRLESAEIDILLGVEDCSNIFMDQRIKGPKGTPNAHKTHIGWIVYGSCPIKKDFESFSVNNVQMNFVAEKYWELEHIGILPKEPRLMNRLELEAIKQYSEKTRMVNGKYETGLIFHPDFQDHKMASNKDIAFKRLRSLERRLNKDQNLAERYTNELNELITAGRIEKVVEDKEPEGKVFYLPHHPVIRDDKTTSKLRIVFDGSSKGHEGLSLNDTLLSGPALQPDLMGILMRFRRHKVAIVCDIAKMFLQIKISECDRDCQRLLWRNLDSSKPPDVYRLTCVTFGLKPSPFSSIKTVQDHVQTEAEKYPIAAQEVKENTFVDDVLSGADSTEDAANLAVDMRNILSTGGFPLRKFLSNEPSALCKLDQNDLASNHDVTFNDELFTTKTLGVKYCPSDDTLMFSFCDKMEEFEVETRRTLLSQLNMIYDPVGVLAPFTISAKLMLQESWIAGDWDDSLPPSLHKKWIKWKSEVKLLDNIKVNRCYVPKHFVNPTYSLHGFADGSEVAYNSVLYLCAKDSLTGEICVSLLCAKPRVAPIAQKRSVPELELMAALITARLIDYVKDNLNLTLQETYCWSDSEDTLIWLSKQSWNWKTFVANRVSNIHNLIDYQWRFIPGEINPADCATRGFTADELIHSDKWFNGPAFLRLPESEWPKQKASFSPTRMEQALKYLKPKVVQSLSVTTDRDNVLITYVKRFESYIKFLNVFVLVRNLLRRIPQEGSIISVSDRRQEELIWIKWAQSMSFGAEIELLKEKKPVQPVSKIANLDPKLDSDEILHVGGRLQRSLLPEESREPIILPSHNCFVEKLVMHVHCENTHSGVAQTLALLRANYWLINGKKEIRRILHQCVKCRRPVPMGQKMGSLPEVRVNMSPGFSSVGVDFAGPLYLRDSNDKVYIALFTCLATRGVHLELCNNLSAEEFLRAFERMQNRRGKSSIVYSDNAKTFKKADSVLAKLFKNPKTMAKIQDKLNHQGIEWRYITEKGPWQGGCWERLVQSVKTPLKRVLGKAKLTDCELRTLLTDIEVQLNSRPLTELSSDKEDPLPLTPGHLLIGRNPSLLPDVDSVTKSTPLGKRWQYRQLLSKQFWNRWSREYVLGLNSFKKWVDERPNAKVDDLVLIADDKLRKNQWILGRIIETHPGRDGLVRSCSLKTASGKIRRPVQRLHLLEASL